MNLETATVLVTGANRGVGRAYVEALLEAGTPKIYAAARNPGQLEALVAQGSGRVVPVQLDVTNPDQIAEAARIAHDVTLLINNAGQLSFGGPLGTANGALSRDMAVNYDGLAAITDAFAPVIERNGGGAVINMLSLLSFVSVPGFAAYNASKAAAWSLTMSLRAALALKGIAILNASPAGIDTEMLAGIDGPKDAPRDVVDDVLAALADDREDVYPASAAGVYEAWRSDQKAVERSFAAMG